MPELKRCSRGGRCRKHQNGVAPLQPIAVFKNKHGTEFANCQTCRIYQSGHTRMYQERVRTDKIERAAKAEEAAKQAATEQAASPKQPQSEAEQRRWARWLTVDVFLPGEQVKEKIKPYKAGVLG